MTNSDTRAAGLLHQGVGAVMWGSLGAVLRIALQIGSQIVLARLLGPENYGIFAVSLTIVLFASMFADMGLAYGLIQRASIDDAIIRFVFTWQIVLGAVVTLVLFVAAHPLAAAFGDARLEPVLRCLAFSSLLASLGATAGMLMRRSLDYKSLNVAVVVSYAVGFVGVGIPMAWLGYGVWALVAANLLQIGLASVILLLSVRHPVQPMFRHPDVAAVLGFGSTVLATNMLNWVMTSLDRLVVGATLQATAAGVYATMGNLMITPVMTIAGVLQSALYSASARAQDDTQKLRVGLRTSLGAVTLFLAPVFFAIGVSAETLVLALYGPAWAGGGGVLRPLAFAMPAFLLMGMAIPSLWTSGRTQWEFRLQLPLAVAWAAVLFAVTKFDSIVVLAWAVCGWFYVRAVLIIGAAIYAIDLDARECVRPLLSGAVMTILVSLAAALTDRACATVGPLFASASIVAACAVTMLAGLLLIRPLMSAEVLRLIDTMAQRVPLAWGQGFLRRVFSGAP